MGYSVDIVIAYLQNTYVALCPEIGSSFSKASPNRTLPEIFTNGGKSNVTPFLVGRRALMQVVVKTGTFHSNPGNARGCTWNTTTQATSRRYVSQRDQVAR